MMHCWYSAADNVVKADEIRTLVKDIWDIRVAKLRSSVDVFLKSDATHAKVPATLSTVLMEMLQTVFYQKSVCTRLRSEQLKKISLADKLDKTTVAVVVVAVTVVR